MKLSEDIEKIQKHSIPDSMDHVNTLNTRLKSLQNRSTNSVSSNDSSHNSVSDLRKTKESSSHIPEYFNPSSKSKMERFMSFDISLKDTSRDSILSFYHSLQVMGPCFDIYLKPVKDMSHARPIYFEGDLMREKKVEKMSQLLFLRLQKSDCLPSDDDRVRALLIAHAEDCDGLNLLHNFILPVIPALRSHQKQVYPTWINSQRDVYILSKNLTLYYTAERTLKRDYTETEKTREYLNILMQSPDHLHIAMDYERDLEKLKEDESPPDNLLLKNIAETIHNIYQKKFSSQAIHKVDYNPTVNYVNKPRSSQPSNNSRQRYTLNKPSSRFKPARFNEQRAGCKRWGHKVSSCFCIAQHV